MPAGRSRLAGAALAALVALGLACGKSPAVPPPNRLVDCLARINTADGTVAEDCLAFVDGADGIDAAEATAIAKGYFHGNVAESGYAGPPARRGGHWVCPVYVGMKLIPVADPITIDARTGVVSFPGRGSVTLDDLRAESRPLPRRRRPANGP